MFSISFVGGEGSGTFLHANDRKYESNTLEIAYSWFCL